MLLSKNVKTILASYKSEPLPVQEKLGRLLMTGKLAGTGKFLFSAVDQGFEHGPLRSFAYNPESFDPLYHFNIAQEAELSGLAAPLGFLEIGAETYAHALPLILKLNSSNTLAKPLSPTQALTASVDDAVRLGCVGVGFTLYPGSNASFTLLEQLRDIIKEARSKGLFTVVWSYPRGNMSISDERSLDIISYGVHMAALAGAHIIKCKLPTAHLAKDISKSIAQDLGLNFSKLEDRIDFVMKSAFDSRRMVVFSGGDKKEEDDLLGEVHALATSKAHGSIIGRNIFQRPLKEAHLLLQKMIDIYLSHA